MAVPGRRQTGAGGGREEQQEDQGEGGERAGPLHGWFLLVENGITTGVSRAAIP